MDFAIGRDATKELAKAGWERFCFQTSVEIDQVSVIEREWDETTAVIRKGAAIRFPTPERRCTQQGKEEIDRGGEEMGMRTTCVGCAKKDGDGGDGVGGCDEIDSGYDYEFLSIDTIPG